MLVSMHTYYAYYAYYIKRARKHIIVEIFTLSTNATTNQTAAPSFPHGIQIVSPCVKKSSTCVCPDDGMTLWRFLHPRHNRVRSNSIIIICTESKKYGYCALYALFTLTTSQYAYQQSMNTLKEYVVYYKYSSSNILYLLGIMHTRTST